MEETAPARHVSQSHAFHRHVLAFHKHDLRPWTRLCVLVACVQHSVQPAVIAVPKRGVLHERACVAVNRTLAGNRDISPFERNHQVRRAPSLALAAEILRIGVFPVVVAQVGAAQQHRPLLQMEIRAVAEPHGSRKICSLREKDSSAALLCTGVQCALNRRSVVRDAVTPRTEITDVEIRATGRRRRAKRRRKYHRSSHGEDSGLRR